MAESKVNSIKRIATDAFIENNTNKHLCKCGCGEYIKIRRAHKSAGIPKFIQWHHNKYDNPMKGVKRSVEYCKKRMREGNPNWNGGRSIDTSGYARVLDTAHKLADTKGYVKEHKLVWTNANGDIPGGHVIHHKNGIKDDNRLENLELMTTSEHNRLTFMGNTFTQKYSESEVVIWAELHDKGMAYRAVSEKVGADISTIFKRVKKYRAKYPLPPWASHQILRASGMIEDICKDNSIGHPNKAWLKVHDLDGSKMLGVHGCDGCCCRGDD